MAGAPSKLTAKRRKIICAAVRCGASYNAAAARAGLHEDTLRGWRKKGAKQDTGPYRRFVDELARAQLEGEALAAEQVFRSFTECSVETVEETLPNGDSRTKTITRPPDPRIALSWLERRVGGRWNPAHRVALGQDPDASPIVTYMLPHNGRDAIPAHETAGGARGVPTGLARPDPEAA